MSIHPRRSALYMPGANSRALDKARGLDADVLILDLEDSVAPKAKEDARHSVCAMVAGRAWPGRETVIRVNGPGSHWFEADFEAACAAGPDAILIPKVESACALFDIAIRLREADASPHVRIWAMIETPGAILRIAEIAACADDPATRLDCLVMGLNDLAKETRARLTPGRESMLPWLQGALIAARAYGLDILDGVCNAINDTQAFEAECRQGRDLGFDGKSLIHPTQIAPANAVFAPDPQEVAQARAILDAFAQPENAGKGVIALDGRMVERLHAQMAERVVALAEAIAARTKSTPQSGS
ncbi:CoA ester lyase [Saliniramus sp.]|uniref:HpcH/HpaI aldolase/citrate lyase family protein n=1 Tax=Saliniramus sp. TaxID=2986772 RepID=UPI002C8CDCE0|nr:CoA ester lyase [Saliniramus sp.]HMB10423.1 CoA ester lyase [Saliniramus sp.]